MIRRMMTAGVFAGFAAGILAAILHFAFIQQVLLLGEVYESGEAVHFGGSGSDPSHASEAGHGHDAAETAHGDGEDGHAHSHGSSEDGGFQRNALTVLFTALVYTAFGLFLAVAFQIAEALGRPIDPRQGVIWGLAGFASFQLAPAMGLAPELPGTIAAVLEQRQAWWVGTVAATAAGLAAMAYFRNIVGVVVGVALLAAPHVIGAPHPDQFWGTAPPELGAEFAARTLGVGFTVWAVLGWLSARFWTSEAA